MVYRRGRDALLLLHENHLRREIELHVRLALRCSDDVLIGDSFLHRQNCPRSRMTAAGTAPLQICNGGTLKLSYRSCSHASSTVPRPLQPHVRSD